MAVHLIEGHGLRIDGHELTRAQAVEQARGWLVANGVDAWDAEGMVTEGCVVRAWWDQARGFVQEGMNGAQPVIAVNVPDLQIDPEGGKSGDQP
jgi:hypothetical protein